MEERLAKECREARRARVARFRRVQFSSTKIEQGGMLDGMRERGAHFGRDRTQDCAGSRPRSGRPLETDFPMRRVLWAGLLALPIMLATAEPAKAQYCSSCAPGGGGGGGGLGRANSWYGSQGPFGCGGFCFKFFGTWLQDGPLVNYGPYEGYYPFQPYGPWTSDLRYTGPTSRNQFTGGCGACGRSGCGGGCGVGGLGGHLGGHLRGLFNKKECGDYALATFGNVFHRTHPCNGRCGN